MSENIHFLGDNPIERIEDDLFNFEPYALKVQSLIQLNSNSINPFTIGIYGKWGEGKTSFLKLLENKIDVWKKEEKQKGILKYHFNPWRYSTEEEMLFDFFDGLAKTMFVEKDSNLQKVGKGILRFSKYLKSVKISASAGISPTNKISATLEPSEIFKALGEDLVAKDITLDKLKNKINEALKISNYKIVVFIDDIDRLDKDEIYTILKLIKLNGNFENFIYIITLDLDQVSKAISNRYGSKKNDGKLFLEKIINIPIHLPRIEREDLSNYLNIKLDEVRKNLNFLNEQKTNTEFLEIKNSYVLDFFKSPREIIRILNSFFISAFSIGDEINLEDLFWLEILKVKHPKVYTFLKKYSFKHRIMILTKVTLNFNDDINSDSLINGTRLKIRNLDHEAFKIVDVLFPVKTVSGTYNDREFNEELMIEELRINTVDNFEKYFSYHTKRKTSNADKLKLENYIREGNEIKTKKILKKFINDSQIEDHKTLYLIENLIRNLKKEDGRLFFYNFLFSNLEILPKSEKNIYGINSIQNIIQLVSDQIPRTGINEQSIIQLATKLDSTQLCYFTRKFENDLDVKEDLKKLIIQKIKTEDKEDYPLFLLEYQEEASKMKMRFWKELNEHDFKNYINKKINSQDSLLCLIRNFVPHFFGYPSYGILDKTNYNNISRILDVEMLYNKAKEFFPELVDRLDVNNYKFSERDDSTLIENLEQFVFWFKKDEKNKPLEFL